MFANWKMNLREFVLANSMEFNDKIPKKDGVANENLKVLGMPWNCKSDTISFPSPKPSARMPTGAAQKEVKLTKRIMMQGLHQTWDPMVT